MKTTEAKGKQEMQTCKKCILHVNSCSPALTLKKSSDHPRSEKQLPMNQYPRHTTSRRDFLSTIPPLLGASLGLPRAAQAIAPLDRKSFMISGVSLAAYSLRTQFAWMKGKPGPGKLEMPGFLDYCASQGLSGAELTAYFFPEPMDFAYCRKIKRQAHLLGIDLTGGAIGNNFTHAPGSEKAKEQLDYTRLWIDRYAEMGIPAIRVFAGNPSKDIPEEQAIANIITNLSEALVHAEGRGVLLGMENHDFTTNVDRFLRILTAIDSPWLGATFDSANVEPQLDPYEQMERLAPYAITAQIKVMIKTSAGKIPTDFEKVAGILKNAAYRGSWCWNTRKRKIPTWQSPSTLRACAKLSRQLDQPDKPTSPAPPESPRSFRFWTRADSTALAFRIGGGKGC